MRQGFAGHAVEQAVLPLRRRALARRRPGRRRRPTPRGPAATRDWRHLNSRDVISMPDTWEYPWFAAWDLAFHCVAAGPRRPRLRQGQLLLLCREWYMHPNGQLPAYEWSFGDVNPPVHAWAALRVFEIDGAPRLRLPRAHLPQAAPELHVVGEPQGRRRATTCSRAASSASTTSGRSTARRSCRSAAASSSPTARRGWRCTASTCSRSRSCSPSRTRPTRTSPRSSSSTSPTSRRP